MADPTAFTGPTADDQPFTPDGNKLPARANAAVIPDDRWYNLKFDYHDRHGNHTSGYAYDIGTNPSTSFWDYISATPISGPMSKFKKVGTEGNRMYLQMADGNYLSCRAAPRLWLYRTNAWAYAVGWEIVDGKLYTDYHAGAVGAEYHTALVPTTYYLQVEGDHPMFNCEWVLAEDQDA